MPNRRKLVAGLAMTSLFLTACGSVTAGTSETESDGTSTRTTDPGTPEPGNEHIAWTAEDIQYIAWDAENKRYISKYNEQPDNGWNPPPIDVRFQAVDPATGSIAWETIEKSVVPVQILVDYTPWPAIPRHESGARLGHIALTEGGSLPPSSHPQHTFYLEFPHSTLDLHTGELADVELPCNPTPYGDIGLCWSREDSSEPVDIQVVESDLSASEPQSTPVKDVGVLELGDYFYLGGSFKYETGMATDGAPETFEVAFLDKENYSVHAVEVPGRWFPNPVNESDWEFTNTIDIVPLQDGILWSNGIDSEWLFISAEEGVGESIELPVHVSFGDVAPGGELATASDFQAALVEWQSTDFAPAPEEDASHLIVFPTTDPILVDITSDTIEWSELSNEESGVHGSTATDSYTAGVLSEGKKPWIQIGPNSRWLSTREKVVDLSTSENWPEVSGMKFLEHVDGLDIFSSTTHGFNDSLADMGVVVAINNPDK